MSKLSEKRLGEIIRFADLGQGLDGDEVADLLDHIDALQAEVAELEAELAREQDARTVAIHERDSHRGDCETSKAEVERLREALQWYADGGPVYDVWQRKESPTFSTTEARRAREVLERIPVQTESGEKP